MIDSETVRGTGPSTLVVLGGTGGTGRALVRRALEGGHRVVARARPPGGSDAPSPALTAERVDLFDPPALARRLAGASAVLCVFGGRKGAPDDELTRFARSLTAAMTEAGVRRLVVVTMSFLFEDEALPRLFGRLFFPRVTRDARNAEEVYRTSGLAWTLVRPPRLTDGPPAGRARSRVDGLSPLSLSISREGLAAFLIEEALRSEHVGRTLGVAR